MLVLKKQITREAGNCGLAGCVDSDAVSRLAEAVDQSGQFELAQNVLKICQEGYSFLIHSSQASR
jgi:hypothetical protein